MSEFAVHLEFLHPPEAREEPRLKLEGSTLTEAKLEAALLFAVAKFGTPPHAYRIVQDGEIEVYRYPECGGGAAILAS